MSQAKRIAAKVERLQHAAKRLHWWDIAGPPARRSRSRHLHKWRIYTRKIMRLGRWTPGPSWD